MSTITTVAPLTGGGDPTSDLTLEIAPASTADAGSMSAADKAKLDALPSDAQSAAQVAAAIAAVVQGSTYAPIFADFVSALTGCFAFGQWKYVRVDKVLRLSGVVAMTLNGGNGTQLQCSVSLPAGMVIDSSGAWPVAEGNIVETSTGIPTIAGTIEGNGYGTPAKLRVGSNLIAAYNGVAFLDITIECTIQ